MLIVKRGMQYETDDGKIVVDDEFYRKAVNIETASEIYVEIDDSLVINTQNRNYPRGKETGMRIENCNEVYGKPAVKMFDEIISRLMSGQKVYEINPLPYLIKK